MTEIHGLLVLAPALLLASCASEVVAPPELCGPRPDDYEVIVKAWLREHVHSADTIRELSITRPARDSHHASWEPDPLYGWRCFVTMKVADSLGAFTYGKRKLYVLIRDGEVVFARDIDRPEQPSPLEAFR